MAETFTLTGERKINSNLVRLSEKSARKVTAAAMRSGMRVIVKGIKAEIPSHMKSARKAVTSRFAKAKGGANKGILQAKVGNVGPQLKKGKGRKLVGVASGKRGKPGVGISRRNLHWLLLGTKERFKKIKAIVTATGKTPARRGASTGIMPQIRAVRRGYAKTQDAAAKKMIDNISKGIAREAAKK